LGHTPVHAVFFGAHLLSYLKQAVQHTDWLFMGSMTACKAQQLGRFVSAACTASGPAPHLTGKSTEFFFYYNSSLDHECLADYT
jgi:hypothetical protein